MSLLYQKQKKYQDKYRQKIRDERPEEYMRKYNRMLIKARENYDDEKREYKRQKYLSNRNYRTKITGTDIANLFIE